MPSFKTAPAVLSQVSVCCDGGAGIQSSQIFIHACSGKKIKKTNNTFPAIGIAVADV
jgi:hypothetical protein